MRHVSITLAMFLNNATCFYHFGDVLKQCDAYLLLWRCYVTMLCVSITWVTSYIRIEPVLVDSRRHCLKSFLAMFWNNATRFYHFGDVLKQCDAFLSLWRCFLTMLCVSITWATCYIGIESVQVETSAGSSRLAPARVDSRRLESTSAGASLLELVLFEYNTSPKW